MKIFIAFFKPKSVIRGRIKLLIYFAYYVYDTLSWRSLYDKFGFMLFNDNTIFMQQTRHSVKRKFCFTNIIHFWINAII